MDKQKYYKWTFILKDGKHISAYFTDAEIAKMKLTSPEIEWPKEKENGN